MIKSNASQNFLWLIWIWSFENVTRKQWEEKPGRHGVEIYDREEIKTLAAPLICRVHLPFFIIFTRPVFTRQHFYSIFYLLCLLNCYLYIKTLCFKLFWLVRSFVQLKAAFKYFVYHTLNAHFGFPDLSWHFSHRGNSALIKSCLGCSWVKIFCLRHLRWHSSYGTSHHQVD